VVSVPLGETVAGPDLHLVSIPSDSVDWEKTDAYAESVRAARYAGTRGPDDFALLNNAVTIALTDIALTNDPARKIAMAGEARQNVTRWIAEHMATARKRWRNGVLFDDVVSRRARPRGRTSTSVIANLAVPPTAPLLPPPTLPGQRRAGAAGGALAPDATERMSLLRAVDRPRGRGLARGCGRRRRVAPLRVRVTGAGGRGRASRGYDADARNPADRRPPPGLADVAGVERVIRRALSGTIVSGSAVRRDGVAAGDAGREARRRAAPPRPRQLGRAREEWSRYRRAIAEPLPSCASRATRSIRSGAWRAVAREGSAAGHGARAPRRSSGSSRRRKRRRRDLKTRSARLARRVRQRAVMSGNMNRVGGVGRGGGR
jgi:hypothetical protein